MKEITRRKIFGMGCVVAALVAVIWSNSGLGRLEESSVICGQFLRIMREFSLNFSNSLAFAIIIVGALAVLVGVEYLRKDREVKSLKTEFESKNATLKIEAEKNVSLIEDKAAKEMEKLQTELAECQQENVRLLEQLQGYEEELKKSLEFENNIVAQLAYCEKFFQTIQELHPEFDFRKEMENLEEQECKKKAAEIDLAYEEAKAKKMSLSYAYQLYQLLSEKEITYVSTLVAAELQKFAMERAEQEVATA